MLVTLVFFAKPDLQNGKRKILELQKSAPNTSGTGYFSDDTNCLKYKNFKQNSNVLESVLILQKNEQKVNKRLVYHAIFIISYRKFENFTPVVERPVRGNAMG